MKTRAYVSSKFSNLPPGNLIFFLTEPINFSIYIIFGI